jgi:NADH-quinone oxidoreductase subunit M
MILTGSFAIHPVITAFASVGLIFATLYSLRIMRKIFYGKFEREERIADASRREILILGILVILVAYIGLFPQKILDTSREPVNNVLEIVKEPGKTINTEMIKPQ